MIFKRKRWDHRQAPAAITGFGLKSPIWKVPQPLGETVLGCIRSCMDNGHLRGFVLFRCPECALTVGID